MIFEVRTPNSKFALQTAQFAWTFRMVLGEGVSPQVTKPRIAIFPTSVETGTWIWILEEQERGQVIQTRCGSNHPLPQDTGNVLHMRLTGKRMVITARTVSGRAFAKKIAGIRSKFAPSPYTVVAT
jgi:hypothetical protein